MRITVETLAHASLSAVWQAWTTPADILQWNAASADWHTTQAEVDLRVGGAFRSRMEARDGSMGFDFEGVYTEVLPLQRLAARFGERALEVDFTPLAEGVRVVETFEAETTFSPEQQRQGWQAILDSFARHVQAQPGAAEDLAAATLRTSRVLAAGPQAVWAAFADGGRLARWWGPAGFSNVFETFDFRPGGAWRFDMIGPDGQRYANVCRFGELRPAERLTVHHVVEPVFTLAVTLAAAESGHIRLDWAQTFADGRTARQLQALCGPANEQNLDRLAAELARAG
jgi:uncharacterized protein YndB with AHSA1/START domain